MGFHGVLWGPMGPMGTYVPYGDLWVLWGPMGLMGTFVGDLWDPLGTYGILWHPMGTYGIIWGSMGS